MENLWQAAFDGIPHLLFGNGNDNAAKQRADSAIDRLVDDSDPRLRLVHNYQRQLRPAMEHALAHVNKLVDHIPDSLEVCARTFSADPCVAAFFTNIKELQQLYCSSPAVRQFFEQRENGISDECHALLCMVKDEKHVFGIGLENDHLRRDVPQTLVNFSHHQLLSPSPDEQSARQSLRNCLLQGLLKQAGSPLVDGIGQRRALLSRQQQLHSHLRALEHQQPASADIGKQRADTQRALQQTEQELRQLSTHLHDINDHMKTLIKGLEQAPDSIRINHCDLSISHTNVKLDPAHGNDGIHLNLAEVRLGDDTPKVVSLNRYPRTEFKPAPPASH